MKILAVDDDDIALDILSSALRNSGYADVTTAASAPDAMKLIGEAETPFDCLLLDIVMPGVDGIELCRTLRATELYADTPIVMITAVRDQVHIDRAFHEGATDYVTKPFIGIELGARIRAAEALARLVSRERVLSREAGQVARKLESGEAVALTDRIELTDVPGAIRFDDLEAKMMRLTEGTYAMEVLSLRILGTAALHRKLSAADFRLVIHRVAQAIAASAEKVQLQIAYVGEGCFACVIQSNGARLPSGVAARARQAVEALSFACLGEERLVLEAAMGGGGRTTLWTGREVVDGLHDAIAKVRAASLRRETDAAMALKMARENGSDALRHGGAVRRLVPELFERAEKLSQVQYNTPPEDRVSPRRVKAKSAARG